MKIAKIQCHLVRLPTRRPHRWAALTVDVGSYVLVEITTDEGLTGWGEATALAQWGGEYNRYYGETPATVVHVVQQVYGPELLGADPTDIHSLLNRMDAQIRGHHYARTAVEGALLDINATAAGIPVYALLGGKRRSRIPMAHSIGLMPTEEVLDEVGELLEENVETIKLKVGEDDERDVETVISVREKVGDRINIGVDANSAWRTAPEAARLIRRISEAGLRYVEQPVSGIFELRQLAHMVDVPLMADESAWTARDVAMLGAEQAVSLVSIYTSKAGGLLNAVRMDAVAEVFGIGTNVNGSGETGVGNLANVHLAAAMGSLNEGCVFPVTGLEGNRSTEVVGAMYTDDVLVEPFSYSEGTVEVPDGPGWGIEVDREKVEHYCIQESTTRE